MFFKSLIWNEIHCLRACLLAIPRHVNSTSLGCATLSPACLLLDFGAHTWNMKSVLKPAVVAHAVTQGSGGRHTRTTDDWKLVWTHYSEVASLGYRVRPGLLLFVGWLVGWVFCLFVFRGGLSWELSSEDANIHLLVNKVAAWCDDILPQSSIPEAGQEPLSFKASSGYVVRAFLE